MPNLQEVATSQGFCQPVYGDIPNTGQVITSLIDRHHALYPKPYKRQLFCKHSRVTLMPYKAFFQ